MRLQARMGWSGRALGWAVLEAGNGRQRLEAPHVSEGFQTKEGVGIDGRSLGNGTAFSAVAPSQRPVYDAHRFTGAPRPRRSAFP